MPRLAALALALSSGPALGWNTQKDKHTLDGGGDWYDEVPEYDPLFPSAIGVRLYHALGLPHHRA